MVDAPIPIEDSLDRVRSPAGGVLLVVLSGLGVLRRVAVHDLLESGIGWTMDRIAEEDPELAADLQPGAEDLLAELHLAIGLDPIVALVLWMGAAIGVGFVAVLAVAAFASEEATITALRTEGILRKTGSLFVAGIVVGIAFGLGLSLFVLPGIAVLVATVYVPPAIALEGDGPIAAIERSVDLVREDVEVPALVVVVAIVAFVVAVTLAQLLWLVLPGVAGEVAEIVVQSAAWLFVLALLTRSYVEATRVDAGDDTRGSPTVGASTA